MRRLQVVAAAVGVVVVVVVVAVVLGLPVWATALLLVAAVVGAAVAWVLVGRNARWWGYAERDEDLYVRHGAMFRTLVVVPYGRMQYVDVQTGPLERAF